MNLEELMASTPPMQQHALIKGFQAGAASRDAEIADLLGANRIACEDLVEQQNLRVKYAGQIDELVAALKPFGAIDLVESRLPAEFAMLILRARAAIAKVSKL